MVRNSIVVLLLMMICNFDSKSQINGYYTGSAGYDTSPFVVSDANPTAFMRNAFGIGYFPDSSDFAASYTASLTNLLEYPQNNYHFHKITVDNLYHLFNIDELYLLASAVAKIRVNASAATIYDFLILSPDLLLKYETKFGTISLGVNSSYTAFFNNHDISNFANEANIGWENSINSNINYYINATYGRKDFTSITEDHQILPSPLPPILNGKGKKTKRYGKSKDSLNQPHIVYSSNHSELIDIRFGGDFDITSKLNFATDFNLNINPHKDGMYYSSGSTDLFGDISLFDDYYNFEEKAIEISAKYSIVPNFRIKAAYRHYDRLFNYSLNLINYSYSDKIKRKDSGDAIRIDFLYKNKFLPNLLFKMSMSMINHLSNAKEYQFNSKSIQFSTIYEF